MTSQQKFDHTMSLKPFASKKDIPVFPHICTFAAVPAGVTQADIFKAYEILKGYQVIRGDVPPALLAFSTPDKVSEYCDKLLDMGMEGGFILGSGCEVPLNCKIENLKAMIASVK